MVSISHTVTNLKHLDYCKIFSYVLFEFQIATKTRRFIFKCGRKGIKY